MHDIVKQLEDCLGLMWHWSHNDTKASIFVRQLTLSLELQGKKVFPDFKTCWHYDDKVGQKYLLETIGAPFVPSYIYYDKTQALQWAEKAEYPKVFKLSKGASSENVWLIKNSSEAKRMITRAFGRGFKIKNRINFLTERIWHFRRDRSLSSFLNIGKGLARLLIPTKTEILTPVEKNYIYFQDFIPNSKYDIRVCVIGKRAYAFMRMVRKGDFRASGSGLIVCDPQEIPLECIKIAFNLSNKLQTQSTAYDFIVSNGDYKLLEISYAFAARAYKQCQGYWDNSLNWIEGHFVPQNFMIEDFLESLGEF